MNKVELSNILQHPQYINEQQTVQLKEILAEFPYFQSARALYLKGLKNEDSYQYNNALKLTAAYTSDRSILFDYITSNIFHQQVVSEKQQQLQDQIIDFDVIDAEEIIVFDSETSSFDEKVIDPNLFETKKTDNDAQVLKDNLEVEKPLAFGKKETHSFQEWLSLSAVKPIKRDGENSSINANKPTKMELVDQFIVNKPKIKPVKKSVSLKNLATQNSFNSEELMTETLAKVYLAQNNYKQAKQAYRILSLKYPEKSSFFAVRISDIEKLEKNKTK